MATQTQVVKVCDVYAKTRNVGTYRITIEQLEGETPTKMIDRTADLSDKAFDRLCGFITRGLTPPGAAEAQKDQQPTLPHAGD